MVFLPKPIIFTFDVWELAVLALAGIMCADIHSSLAWQSEIFWKPTHPNLRMAADLTASPPADVPDALREGIEKLGGGPLRNLLMAKAVPHLIQHCLGMDKYTTIEDVADRWDTAQAARQHGPATMQFRDGDHGFTAESSAYAAMKLFQAVRAAKDLLQSTLRW